MQIIVPAAGRGSRFAAEGYIGPKPLIPALGKPLIQWSIDGLRGIDGAQLIFLILQEHIERYELDKVLKKMYPGSIAVPVKEVTEGAACTVLLAKPHLNLSEDMAIVNCDNLFFIDLARAKQQLQAETSAIIFYFASNYDRWSYVATDANGYATKVAEKDVISDKATVGCYYFRKARYFTDAAEYMIHHNMRTKGEFYVSPVYNVMVKEGHKIQTMPCDLHFSLGTPEEVRSFEQLFYTAAIHKSAAHAGIKTRI